MLSAATIEKSSHKDRPYRSLIPVPANRADNAGWAAQEAAANFPSLRPVPPPQHPLSAKQ